MPTRSRFKNLALDQLDDTLAALRKSAEVQRPPKGWARSIREALGMSLGQLARRVGVSRETIATLERSEARERYLAALRAADARDFAPLLAFVRSTG